jgi:hypothetical protein
LSGNGVKDNDGGEDRDTAAAKTAISERGNIGGRVPAGRPYFMVCAVFLMGTLVIRVVMIERAIAGIEHEVQQRVRVGVGDAGSHLHRKQQERDECESAGK